MAVDVGLARYGLGPSHPRASFHGPITGRPMKLSLTTKIVMTVAGLTLVQLQAAKAGSISTPILLQGAGNQIICIANNITAAAVNNVTVRIVGVNGNATENCDIAANDGSGCQAFRNNDAGYCVISIPGLTGPQVAARLRGSLIARKTTSPFTIDAVVEAR